MRYYTRELWKNLNSTDEALRSLAELEWEKKDKEYSAHFDAIKKYLPIKFLKKYMECNEFHDYVVNGMKIFNVGSRYKCEIALSADSENLLVTMHDVHAINIDVSSFQSCVMGKIAWGYSEFDITSTGNISLSVLCDFCNEIGFEFKNMEIEQIA